MHVSAFCPFDKFYFADQFRFYPGDGSVGFRPGPERAFRGNQRQHFTLDSLQRRLAEAASCMPDVFELTLLIDSEDERAKLISAAPRLGKIGGAQVGTPVT